MMRRLFVLLSILFVASQAQFLDLPTQLQDLIPAEIQEVLNALSPEQVKALKEIDTDKKLGTKLVEAIYRLKEKYDKLSSATGGDHIKNYYNLLATITKDNIQGPIRSLVQGYDELTAEDKKQLKELFPNIVRTLESPEVRSLGGIQ